MANWNVGAKNGMWRGGRSRASNGYVLVRVGGHHHLADVRGYAYEHRLVAEQTLGRRLRRGEQVHHINGNKADNHPGNLEVCRTRFHHRAEHRQTGNRLRNPGERNPLVLCRCGCGRRFRRFDACGRPRDYLSGHNMRTRAEKMAR